MLKSNYMLITYGSTNFYNSVINWRLQDHKNKTKSPNISTQTHRHTDTHTHTHTHTHTPSFLISKKDIKTNSVKNVYT